MEMATFTNVNTPAVNPSAAPTTNVITAAGDQFAAEHGAVYLVRFANGSASPGNVVLDDPIAVTPVGATAFNPDVTVAIPAGEVREMRIDAARFRHPTSGMIVWTYSANITNAASLATINRIQ
jgi:hypothetical protein